tara:strand:+ start:196 stop:828 length:633 start_codon:yes stop_codon:yes gene_type:complete
MSDKSKKTLGWNPTYFGEPKPGSLAAVIADVTTKQNAVVGEKPEVQSSAAVQAKEQQAKSEAMDPKANDKMDSSKDMRKKNKKDAEGEKHSDPVDIKGEDVNKEIEKAQQGKIKSLVDTIKNMYYSEAKQEDEGNAFGKALMAAKKNGEKEFVVGGKKYNVEQELDKVNPTAVKKKFKDRKDKDIDNDGDVDDSDRYLHKRRKAISKEID